MKKFTSYVVTRSFPGGDYILKTFLTAKKVRNYSKFYTNTVTEIHKEIDTKSKEIISIYYRKKD